jgi:hypothetical protein
MQEMESFSGHLPSDLPILIQAAECLAISLNEYIERIENKQPIGCREPTIMISAASGSGKTSILELLKKAFTVFEQTSE